MEYSPEQTFSPVPNKHKVKILTLVLYHCAGTTSAQFRLNKKQLQIKTFKRQLNTVTYFKNMVEENTKSTPSRRNTNQGTLQIFETLPSFSVKDMPGQTKFLLQKEFDSKSWKENFRRKGQPNWDTNQMWTVDQTVTYQC